MFQHTATRRWLLLHGCRNIPYAFSFNTQPPEGGCFSHRQQDRPSVICFNTQPPEGGCSLHKKARKISKLNTVFR